MVPIPGVRVAVIPARGGSKRLPRKNIRQFDGKPLIYWTIETCLQSGLFDRVIVTTDDVEIAEIAQQFGAEIPFMRAAHLAGDHTPLAPVLADTVSQLGYEDIASLLVCCVYPTAVGTISSDLESAAQLLGAVGMDGYVVGVVRYGHPIERAMLRDDEGRLSMVDPSAVETRTQDLEPKWHDAGQFVWGSALTWLTRQPILANARGFELPSWRAIDIDNEDDWTRAEQLHRVSRAQPLR